VTRLILLVCAVLLASVPTVAYAQCPTPSDGLVAHWTLDESGNTSTAVDSAGSNNGTLTSFPADPSANWVAGKIDNGLDFDGSNDYVDAGNGSDFDITGDITVSAWVYATAAPGSEGRTILSRFDSSNTKGWNFGASWTTPDFEFELYEAGTGDGGAAVYTGYFTTELNQWHHMVGVVKSSSYIRLYMDGELIEENTADAPDSLAYTAGDALRIGNRSNGQSDFQGQIDDARIYNRALSADEVQALYALRSTDAAAAGVMMYDTRHERMMYCNGTNWVHAGTGPYNPNAVTFEDTTPTYLTSGAGMTGAVDSKLWSGSLWFRYDNNDWEIFDTAGGGDLSIDLFLDGKIQIGGRNGASTIILDIVTPSATPDFDDNNWHHLLFSVDMSDTAKRHLYVDDIDRLDTVNTYTDDVIDFTQSDFSFGATTAGAEGGNGDIADVWLDFGSYIDFSNTSNRRRFISASGLPMYLGEDGSVPLGNPPDIFFSGDTVTFQSNRGSGGGFTENGTLSTAAAQPGDSLLSTIDIDSGLISHWTLNEETGTEITDSAGSNTGTWNGEANVRVASEGKVGSSLDFDGTDDYVQVDNDASLETNEGTWALWVYNQADAENRGIMQFGQSGWNYKVSIETLETERILVRGRQSTEGWPYQWYIDDLADNTVPLNTWTHIAVTQNGTSPKLYINGQIDPNYGVYGGNQGFWTNDISDPDHDLYIAGDGGNGTFDGFVDDVRVYSRALTANEIETIYHIGVPGAMQYNFDFHVMEYYNGAEWVAMGLVGGTPPTNGLAGHWKFDETSGTTAVDSINGNDGTMINGLSATTDSVDGILGKALKSNGNASSHGVESANPTELDAINDTMTVAFWYNESTGTHVDYNNAVQKIDWGTPVGWDISAGASDDIRIHIDTSGGSNQTVGYIYGIYDGNWHHVAWTLDSGVVRAYQNGVLVADDTYTHGTGFGTSAADLKTLGLAGSYDDLRIYDRALSLSEIQRIYHFGASGGLGDVDNACANPTGVEGQMIYNVDYTVMQYCNGEAWVGIGK